MGDENYRYDYENHPDKLEKNSYFEFPVASDSHPIFERHLQKKKSHKIWFKMCGVSKKRDLRAERRSSPYWIQFLPGPYLKSSEIFFNLKPDT